MKHSLLSSRKLLADVTDICGLGLRFVKHWEVEGNAAGECRDYLH